MSEQPKSEAPSRDIVVEGVLPHSPAVVWMVLTRSDLIGRWLMPNDFELRLGKKFTFRTKPMGDWDGIVHCEILEIEPERRLAYSWIGGSDANPAYGSRLVCKRYEQTTDLAWTA